MGISNSCCHKNQIFLRDTKQTQSELDFKVPNNIVNIIHSTIKNPVNFDLYECNNKQPETLTFITSHNKEFKFKIISLLGKGSFGKVYLVNDEKSHIPYAMKVIEKKMIKKLNYEDQTMRERSLLEKINSPFVIKLKFAFQSKENLFFVTDFAQGGDLFYHLLVYKCFPEERVKLYVAEIALGLEALHSRNCIYRDLKPDNILIDKHGHLKLTDFGLSKVNLENSEKSFSIVGTPGYFAPEILLQSKYDHRVDYWSLGVIMYQMLEGRHPYDSLKLLDPKKKNKSKFEETIQYIPVFSEKSSLEARELCKQLLSYDPNDRPNSFREIQSSGFFEYYDREKTTKFDWSKVTRKEYNPAFIPELIDENDIKYFSKFFTEQHPDTLIYQEKIKNGNNNNNNNKNSELFSTDEINYQTDNKANNEQISEQNNYPNFTYINALGATTNQKNSFNLSNSNSYPQIVNNY